jgi:hypothetical protein
MINPWIEEGNVEDNPGTSHSVKKVYRGIEIFERTQESVCSG